MATPLTRAYSRRSAQSGTEPSGVRACVHFVADIVYAFAGRIWCYQSDGIIRWAYCSPEGADDFGSSTFDKARKSLNELGESEDDFCADSIKLGGTLFEQCV